jgi:type IV pilus assembly protein PilC
MPTFAYEALNAAGKPQKGSIEATTTEEAIQRIKGQGFFPTSVREQKGKQGGGGGGATATAKKPKAKGGFSIGGVSAKNLTARGSCPPCRTRACRCCARCRFSRASRSRAR